MVFFTCNHCGESVKKPSVEKHYTQKCRGAVKNVSCMDCQKDFRGEEYVAHTKCISEAEKYSGKDYVHKEAKNSGAKKQESWMDIIRSILETQEYNLSAQARNAFQRLQSVDNVPRKKAKFQNFVANCMRMPRGQSEEVWTVLEKELEKMKQAKQQEAAVLKAEQEVAKQEKQTSPQNGLKREATAAESDGGSEKREQPVKKKSKKPQPTENGKATNGEVAAAAAAEEIEPVAIDEFQWLSGIEKIVTKNAAGITLEKLKKKLLKKYTAKLAVEELTEKQLRKFEKKFAKHLKNCPKVQVEGEVAKMC